MFNTLFGYGLICVCMYLAGMTPEISNVVGYASGLIVSYVLNKNYPFNSDDEGAQQIIRFIAVFGVAYAANLGVLFCLIHRLGLSKGRSQICAGIIYVVASFILNKCYVFRDSKAET
ncbi:MAG: GtrA family protein [Terriglobia bacterium]